MWDYALRGKCRELSEKACEEDPTLRLVRGFYYCWEWGKQPHWWTVRPDGTIYDVTAAQFPSLGQGVYEEFDGTCQCSECGSQVREEDGIVGGNGHYVFCSGKCYGRFVGVSVE